MIKQPTRKQLVLFLFSFFTYACVFAQTDSLKADSLYYTGKDHYYDGDYDLARQHLLQCIELQTGLYGAEHPLLAQTIFRLSKVERRSDNFKQALSYLDQSLEMTKAIFGDTVEAIGDHYIEYNQPYGEMYDQETALKYGKRALSFFKNRYGENNPSVGLVYNDLGINFEEMGRYNEALEYYFKALDIFKQTLEPDDEDFNRIYNNIGLVYRRMGDYASAAEYAEKALTIKLKNYKETHPSVPKYYINWGKALMGAGEFDQGFKYVQKFIDLTLEIHGPDDTQTGDALSEVAEILWDEGKYDAAIQKFKESLSALEVKLPPSRPYVVHVLSSIGEIYLEKKDYTRAMEYFLQVDERFKNLDRIIPHFIADNYLSKADVYKEQKKFSMALRNIGNGMELLSNGFEYKEGQEERNPDITQVQAQLLMLDLLHEKAKILELQSNQQSIKELTHAVGTMDLAFTLIEKIRKSYQSESSRLKLSKNAAQLFEDGIRIAFQLYELTNKKDYLLKALEISEKSKASILWQHQSANLALEGSGIEKERLEALDELGAQINTLEEKVFNTYDDQVERIKSELFDLRATYTQKIEALEQTNPVYYNLKYASPKIDFSSIIQKIPDEQTSLVEYFYSEDQLYVFVFSKQGLEGFKLPFSNQIGESIQYIRDFEIQDYFEHSDEKKKTYLGYLNQLYQTLVEPLEQVIQSRSRIVIIPHGVLNYLPFEILSPVKGEEDFRKLDYLIKRHTIQYEYSLALWERKFKTSTTHRYDLVSFAPFINDTHLANTVEQPLIASRNERSILSNSLDEVKGALASFPGESFVAHQATEHTFQQMANQTEILHLATHAIANDEDPMRSGLYFSNQLDSLEDGFLTVFEIYNMKIPAKLAVLSACNTGTGQLAKGEGVLSLGRAFSYAGCESVLMSLWMANDQSTSKLITSFYERLATGDQKDVALRNAKLAFLDQADPITAHPYFWSGIVAAGDMSPIASDSFPRWWIGLLALAGFALFVYYNSKPKK